MPSNTNSRLRIAMLAALAALGCYSDVPLAVIPPQQRTQLVLELSDAGTERLGGLLGRNVVSARGHLLDWSADSIQLEMIATQSRRGDETLWQHETVAIPRDAVGLVRERKLNGPRTAIATLGALGVLFAAQQAISGSNSGKSTGSSGGGKQ